MLTTARPTDSRVHIPLTKNVQATFGLTQFFHNPFSAVTTIDYSLPSSANITLKVYNALGEEVATPVNVEMEVGLYIAVVHGENLSNGVNFYRLRANNVSKEHAMMIVK